MDKVKDCILRSERRPCYLGFLDESEAACCEDILIRRKDISVMFWGGYGEAQRKMVGFFPDYLEPSELLFPMVPLTFSYRKEDVLGHRDFLGSFMALGIQRSVIGDILASQGRCVVFIRREMQSYFTDNIRKIGKVGVRISEGYDEPLPLERKFLELSGVVASPRLDCIVAFLCRTSREKASGIISSGAVMINHRESLSLSDRVDEGDLISVRKHGKFIIDCLGPLTSKGRLSMKCRKYQ